MHTRSSFLTSPRLSGLVLPGIFVALALTMPAYAVKTVKVSNYGNGHQIWFEAEDFDERNPNAADYSPVVDMEGVFGQAVGRTGASGGMMRWTFDISVAGGKGGTWYFWGRVLNPNNRSDYLLIEGDPQGPAIPSGPSFPAGNETAPFLNARDRIFEETVTDWGWVRSGHPEGHTKQLQNGENNMYVFRREGTNDTVFWDVFMWTDDPDYTPTDDDYRNATVPVPGIASSPLPDVGATDVPRDIALSWTAGDFASRHDVYFGTDATAVTQATATADPGGVYQGRVDPARYAVGLLAYGQTYYWRVDEVNAPPDGTIFPGNVWSFTVEPYVYRITDITATASSAQDGMGPENTINGSGLNAADEHSTDAKQMWLSTGELPNWIQYEFDQVYKLHEMWVWNSNQLVEPFIGFGAKDVKVEYSVDGTDWMELADVPEFAQGTGLDTYSPNTTVSFSGVFARYVRLTILSPWGLAPQSGLSEVRFFHIPVQARAPRPASDATDVALDVTLNWRPGREAASHDVYFGADANAVADATVPNETLSDHSYNPAGLGYGQTYYWRVDEVNGADIRTGDVWSFSTQEFLSLDDFEGYTDDEGSRIYEAWVDGWTNGTGSTVGYVQSPFAERVVVHGGRQSMPLDYNNANSPFYSEAERTWDQVRDWTANGADTLMVHFRGNPVGFLDAGGTITMSAGGADIWNTADEFRFAFKSLTGDGTLVAKVESIGNSDPWAKAGVMVRETLDPGSRFAAVYATPGNGVRYQARLLDAGSATSDTSVATAEQMAMTTPVWIKIERKGSSFSCFYSTDGSDWTTMSWNPQTINMATTVYIGLAMTSHNTSATTTAEFSNISTTGTVTGTWQAQAIGVAQPANDAAPLYVAVEDSAGKVAVVSYPDPVATTLATWQAWQIPLSEFSSAGVKLTAVKTLYLGVGDRANPAPDGAGIVFIDDIGVGHPATSNP